MPTGRALEIKMYTNRRGSAVPSPRTGDYPTFNGKPVATTLPMGVSTTDATVTPLPVLPAADPAEGSDIKLVDGQTVNLTAKVVAVQTGGVAGTVGDSGAFVVEAAAKLIGTTYSLVGTPVIRALVDGAFGGVPTVTVDANGIQLNVTGEVNKDIDWSAQVDQLVIG